MFNFITKRHYSRTKFKSDEYSDYLSQAVITKTVKYIITPGNNINFIGDQIYSIIHNFVFTSSHIISLLFASATGLHKH